MAKKFELDADFKLPQVKAPTFNNSGNQFENKLMALMALQARSQAGQQATPGEVIVGRTDPYTGQRTVTPQAAEEEGRVILAKEKARLVPKREVLGKNLVRMKALFDQAPRPEAGLVKRGIGSFQNMIRQQSQSMPQIDQYEDFKKSLAGDVANVVGGETGARLSDFDIQRVINAVPDIIGDTSDRGLLGWKNLFDTIDDIMTSYGAKTAGYSQEMFSPQQLGRAKVLQGNVDITTLSNDEILGAVEGDVSPYPKPIQEALLREIERRKMA